MKGFDFGQIGEKVSKVMDTDYIDIRRDIDGSLVEVYSNVSCHIAYVSVDNPDPTTVDIKPIIQGLRIHMPLWVDVRNNDFLVAKKIGSDNTIQATYSGRCGNPVVSMGRKVVMVTMDATEPYDPTPIPPTNPIEINVDYMKGDARLIPSTTHLVEKGESFVMSAPSIEGYEFSYHMLDGIINTESTVIINDVESTHSVVFMYDESEKSDMFRFLVNGLYTRDDGRLANGWHTYSPIAIDSISYDENNDIYTITSDDVTFEHADNGRILSIKNDALIVLYPEGVFVKVIDVTPSNRKVTFTAKEFVPTEAQANFYETRWYD